MDVTMIEADPLRAEFERQHKGRNLTRHPTRGTYTSGPIAALWSQHKRTAEWLANRGQEPGAESRSDDYLFEKWAKNPIRAAKLPLEKHINGAYKDYRTYIAFVGWHGRSKQHTALFIRPEGVDLCARNDGPFIPGAANAAAYERLRLACCLQQPAPVPDQMALVWRADVMRMRSDLIHKQAFFDHNSKAEGSK